MICPTCDAALFCAACRNPVQEPSRTALSSEEPLTTTDGDLAFPDMEDDELEDEDAVNLAIGYDEDSGLVIINFGKPTSWLALSPENAEDLANLILRNATESRLSQAS